MRNRPFPAEEDLASLDEEALKAKEEAEKDDDDEEEWIGEIELSAYSIEDLQYSKCILFYYGALSNNSK